MWRDQFLQASFRGVPFLLEQSSYEGGRRVVVHEFAARDTPLAEDLGRRARKWDVEAWVMGDDYRTGRDQLRTALETSGAGVLVHPYYGVQTVQVDSLRIRETTDKGGLAVFSITFHEAGSVEPAKPLLSDTVVAITDAAMSTVGADLVLTGWQGDDASTTRTLEQVATLSPQPLPAELAAPVDVDGDSTVGWMAAVSTWMVELRTDSAWWTQLITQTWPIPRLLNSSQYQRSHTLQTELTLVTLRRVLFITLVRRLITLSITDAGLARTLREQLLLECEQLLYWKSAVDGRGTPASVVQGLISARKAALVYLGDLLRTLPVYTALTLRSALPALVLSYQRYGTPDRAQQILDRNGLHHPLFVVGNLEVLSE